MLSGVREAKHPVHLRGTGCFGGCFGGLSTGSLHDMPTEKFVKDTLLNLNLAQFLVRTRKDADAANSQHI